MLTTLFAGYTEVKNQLRLIRIIYMTINVDELLIQIDNIE